MFKYLTFSFSSVFIGLIIALVAAIILFLSVQIWNQKHTPISIGIVLLLTIFYFILGATFVGLNKTKRELRDYQKTTEYKMAQAGTDLLNSISPDLYKVVSPMIDEQTTKEYIEGECDKITRYQWFASILSILIFAIGLFGIHCTTMSIKRRSSYSRTHRNEGEYRSHSRHRSDD
jgi:predicted PurR-regulated permease PerM